jgi:hypothetical protein
MRVGRGLLRVWVSASILWAAFVILIDSSDYGWSISQSLLKTDSETLGLILWPPVIALFAGSLCYWAFAGFGGSPRTSVLQGLARSSNKIGLRDRGPAVPPPSPAHYVSRGDTRFIRTDGPRFVNLHHVVAVEMLATLELGHKWHILTVKDRDDDIINIDRSVVSMDWDDMMATLGQVIPADLGAWVYVVGHPILTDRPTINDVFVQKEMVVGWILTPEIGRKRLVPLIPTDIQLVGDDPIEDYRFIFPTPDGRFTFEFEGTFKDLDEAKQDYLREICDAWDKEHKPEEDTGPS